MKNGFTLVELSIVLVIIGLLIGGILVGQSLIDSAKINQAVRQIQQYDIAVSQFQNKFRQLPGDSNLMTPPGNNDGDISSDVTGETSCGQINCPERFSFWKHLTDSGTLQGSYSNDFSSGSQAGINAPVFQTLPLAAIGLSSDTGAFGSEGWSYETSGESTELRGPFVFALESKIDDGDVATGFVRAYNADFSACGIDDGVDCVIVVTIMSTNGNPLNN